ncbi:hypothetical protein [Streptomyces sp. NPDC018693]|uniref:hypothetical protein n=1 Tax=unclassified Streptomyces TaxID=2593676 RepID=UPI003788F102
MLDVPGLPLPDQVTKTLYVLFPDGMLGRITASAVAEPALPEGAKLVTQERYEELRAQMRERHEARVRELLAAEKESRRQQYEELLAVPGISEATARALSGHGGPLDDDSGPVGGGS